MLGPRRRHHAIWNVSPPADAMIRQPILRTDPAPLPIASREFYRQIDQSWKCMMAADYRMARKLKAPEDENGELEKLWPDDVAAAALKEIS